jgi:anti-sigma B factor antagonist
VSAPSFGEIAVETTGGGTEVVLTGEVDLAAVRRASHQVDAVMCAPPSRLDIDASGVTFIDSSGVAMLVKLHAVTTGAGGTVHLRRPSPPVVRLLDICGLLDTFEVRRVRIAVPPG